VRLRDLRIRTVGVLTLCAVPISSAALRSLAQGIGVVCVALKFWWTGMPVVVSAQGTGRFESAIAAIAAGQDSTAREQAIVDYLKRTGIDVRVEAFDFPQFKGANIVATVPGRNATKTLLLGAHYDRTPRGRGAVDNAASCAVVEQLLTNLLATPLNNYSVTAVFFDLEERGLIGSQAYFARHQGEPLPHEAINLDIFGYGDTLFVDASSLDSPLLTSLQQAAQNGPIRIRAIDSMNRYPASDHRIMMSAKIDTLGVALIDGTEVDSVLEHGPTEPRIATIIHTDADTIDVIRPQEMERAFALFEKGLRLLDSGDKAGETVRQ
jgi:aminopeptidase S